MEQGIADELLAILTIFKKKEKDEQSAVSE